MSSIVALIASARDALLVVSWLRHSLSRLAALRWRDLDMAVRRGLRPRGVATR